MAGGKIPWKDLSHWDVPAKYPRELRERAVRMVAEVRPDYPSEYAAMTAVAGMLGVGSQKRSAAGFAASRLMPEIGPVSCLDTRVAILRPPVQARQHRGISTIPAC